MNENRLVTKWLDPTARSDSCYGDNITNREWCDEEITANPGMYEIVTNPKTFEIALARVDK
jgi:hypothetical protein